MEVHFDEQSISAKSLNLGDERQEINDVGKALYLEENANQQKINMIPHNYSPATTHVSDLEMLRTQINVTSIQRDTEFLKRDEVMNELLHRHERIEQNEVSDIEERNSIRQKMESYYETAQNGRELVKTKLETESSHRLGKTRRSRMNTSVNKLRSARERLAVFRPTELSHEKRMEAMEKIYSDLHSSDRNFAEAVAKNKEEENNIKDKADLTYNNNLMNYYNKETNELEIVLMKTISEAGTELESKIFREDISRQKEVLKKAIYKKTKFTITNNLLMLKASNIQKYKEELAKSSMDTENEYRNEWEEMKEKLAKAERKAKGLPEPEPKEQNADSKEAVREEQKNIEEFEMNEEQLRANAEKFGKE